MGKSSKKANVEVAQPAIPVPSSKPAIKGKRNAEAALEKTVNAKKPKKEIQKVQLKQKDVKKLSKAPPPKKLPETSSSEDASSESEEEAKITLKKGAKQPVKQEAKESSSSEDSSSDEKTNAPSKKPTSVAVPMEESESSDSSYCDSDEDEDTVQNVAASNKVLPPQKSGAAQVSSSGTSDSESDDEKEMAKKTSFAKKNPPKVAAVPASKKEELSESSESESEEEEVAAKVSVTTKRVPAAPKAGVTAAPKKKVESTSSSGSDSDSDEAPAAVPLKTVEATQKKLLSKTEVDESSEESSDESVGEPRKKKLKLPGTAVGNAAKPNVKTAKKESSSDEDESSGGSSGEDLSKAQEKKTKFPESSSSEEDSSEESEDEQPVEVSQKKDNDVKMKKMPSINGTEDQIAKKIEKKGEKTPGSNQSAAPGSKTLFVGNLSFDVGEDDIVEFFKEAGEVSDVRLTKGDDGRVRGFGHVEFSTAEAAHKAVDELNGKELFGRAIKLDFARERGSYTPYSGKDNKSFQKLEKEQSFTIFVRGFDKSLEMDQIQSTLEEHFGSCGEITRVSLPRDYESGGSKGIGYIDFKDRGAFSKALELNDSELGDYSLTVEEARPRNDSRDGGWTGGRGGSRGGGRSSGGRSDGRGRGGRGGRGRGGGYRGNPYK